VVPAYRRLIAFFEQQLPRSTTDDGVWKLPDGDAYYRHLLREQTSTRMTPQEVHDLGLAEVARIEAEMKAILLAQAELRPQESVAQALARLAREPRFLYPDNDDGRRAALADYSAMLREQLERSKALFGRLPAAQIEVRRVPEFKDKTAPGAYYNPPAMDGGSASSSPTCATWPRHRPLRTLAIHEGVPGHHFQIAIAQERGADLPRCPSPPTWKAGRSTPNGWARTWACTRTIRTATWAACRPRCSAPCGWSSTPASTSNAGRASAPSPTWSRRPAWPNRA
jgi:uncharacterized protein (DUF885 family)